MALYHKLRQMPKLKVCIEEKMLAHLSSEHCYVKALWFKVNRMHISPIEIEPVKKLYFLCVIFL